jgi:hypothetical protein
MKRKILLAAAFCGLLVSTQVSTLHAQGTAFTYQGRLNVNSSPANGSYDLTFNLYNSSYGGSPATTGLTIPAVAVSNGLFTTTLDFGGGVFNGTTYWLEIAARTNGSGPFVTLATRQQLTPSPYAIFAESVGNNSITGPSIANGTVVRSLNGLSDAVSLTAGPNVSITPSGNSLQISSTGGGWSLSGNSGTTGANFLGTTDNHPLELRVNNARALRLELNTFGASADAPNVIGGAVGNFVTFASVGATIGGGGALNYGADPASGDPGASYTNSVTGDFGTVSGGSKNVSGGFGTVGGGFGNASSQSYATVGGGSGNHSTGSSATVAGGAANTSSGSGATVGGGDNNNSSAQSTTVGGGFGNASSGDYSTVGGGQWDSASGRYATVGGGIQNLASGDNSTVSGGQSNTASGFFASVGGGNYNTASYTCTVAGGDHNTTLSGFADSIGGGYANSAGGNYETIGGGLRNTNSGTASAIGGGQFNQVGAFGTSSDNCVIGGGSNNIANGLGATVSGGLNNAAYSASAHDQLKKIWPATVGGGQNNTASGAYSTVPGGYGNTASGDSSFAAGMNAMANHDRSFIWSSYPNSAPTFGPDTFFVSAANGIGINCGAQRADGGGQYWINLGDVASGYIIQTSVGGCLTTSGVWQCPSDKNRKADFADSDSRLILEKLANLPVRQWRYTNEVAGVKHLGPTAQDFMQAFQLGTDDRTIGTLDESGVALAAIQGLNEKVNEKQAVINELQQRLEKLEQFMSRKNGGDN